VNASGWHRDGDGALNLCGSTGLRIAHVLRCRCPERRPFAWGLSGWVYDAADFGHVDSEEEAQARVAAALRERGHLTAAALATAPLPQGATS
jgi:hypothetical protein